MFMRALTAAVMAAAVLVPSATAQNRQISFTIDNATNLAIAGVYTGPSTDPEWGPNILVEYIFPGETLQITINEVYGECLYDFLLEFEDGSTYEEYQVDICVLNGTEWVIQ